MTVAIDQYKRDPKQSVINFYNGVEPFVKARLACEHWALIVTDVSKATCSGFRNGDCTTVGLIDAIQRLDGIVGVKTPEVAVTAFNDLRKNRNRLVHFYHTMGGRNGLDKIRQDVQADQCKAWYCLHSLLVHEWSGQFSEFGQDIAILNAKMHQHREFLSAKYIELAKQIDIEKKRGSTVRNCQVCGFEALVEPETQSRLKHATCTVCGAPGDRLIATCHNCDRDIEIIDMGKGCCVDCGHVTTLNELFEQYPGTENPYDGEQGIDCTHCSSEDSGTVVPFEKQLLCLYCLQLYGEGSVDNCNHCGQKLAVSPGDVILRCERCAGI